MKERIPETTGLTGYKHDEISFYKETPFGKARPITIFDGDILADDAAMVEERAQKRANTDKLNKALPKGFKPLQYR